MSNPKQKFFDECIEDIKDEIPSDWEDISWLGDECPSYKANGLQIWIDHPDEEQRSTISSLRFGISRINEHGEFVEEIAEEAYFSVVLEIVNEAAQ
jgi:hypothetical protein